MKSVFAVFPYLKIEGSYGFGSFKLRSSNSIEGLSREDIEHLEQIGLSLRGWKDEPVDEFTYIRLEFSEDPEGNNQLIQNLYELHVILVFTLASDAWRFHYEELSLFLFIPAAVVAVEDEALVSGVPGYDVTINWLHWLEIQQGEKLPSPSPYEPVGYPKLLDQEYFFWSLRRNNLDGLVKFIKGDLLHWEQQEARYKIVLRAMSWYNKSLSVHTTEPERLVYLATAFEVLFHDKANSSKTSIKEELRASLRGLFGEAPRLQEWVEQFYDQRSNILHEGFSSQLRFTGRTSHKSEQQLHLDSLTHYGRRLLRMCIFSILHSALLAEEANLGAWFYHDQEILEDICRILDDTETLLEERFKEAAASVYRLKEHFWHPQQQPDIKYATVRAAGARLIQAYIKLNENIEPEIRKVLEEILSIEADGLLRVAELYSGLSSKLPEVVKYQRPTYEPMQVIVRFANYAGGPNFKLQLLNEKRRTQNR